MHPPETHLHPPELHLQVRAFQRVLREHHDEDTTASPGKIRLLDKDERLGKKLWKALDGHDKEMFESGQVKVEVKHAKIITPDLVAEAELNHMFDIGTPTGLQNAVLDSMMKIGAKRVDDVHRLNIEHISLLTGDDKTRFYRFDPSVMKNEQVIRVLFNCVVFCCALPGFLPAGRFWQLEQKPRGVPHLRSAGVEGAKPLRTPDQAHDEDQGDD